MESMESTLSDIQSANRQVKDTVGAYEALSKVFNKYAVSLKDVSTDLELLIKVVKEHEEKVSAGYSQSLLEMKQDGAEIVKNNKTASNEVVASFKKSCVAAVADFNGGLENGIESLESSLAKLSQLEQAYETATQVVSKLKDTIVVLAKDVDSSQKQQDRVLASIDNKTETCKQKTTDIKDKVENIGLETNHIQSDIAALTAMTSNIESEVENIKVNEDTIVSDTRSIISNTGSIKSDVDIIKSEVTAIKSKLTDFSTLCKRIDEQIQQANQSLQNITTSIASLTSRTDNSFLNINNKFQIVQTVQSQLSNKLYELQEDVNEQLRSNRKATIVSAVFIIIILIVLHFI